MKNEHCYKNGKRLEMKSPPIRLAIATVALIEHVSPAWTDHMQQIYKELESLKTEIDFEWQHHFVYNKPRFTARQEVTEAILKHPIGYTHMLFLDCDTFPTKGSIKHMLQLSMNQDYPVLCYPVYLKRMPLISNIYEDVMFAPICKLPRVVFKIDLTGLAACLIELEVFKKIQPPYFEGDWRVMAANDINFHLKTGEDTAFFFKLKRAEISVMCDPNYIWEHYDDARDLFYPSLIGNKERCYEG